MPLEPEIATFEVLGIEFSVRQAQVIKSNPIKNWPRIVLFDEAKHEQFKPLCHAITGCWNRKSFLAKVIERSGWELKAQQDLAFTIRQKKTLLPKARFDLEEGERGVIVYFFEDELEVSVRFFVKVLLEFGNICSANECSVRKATLVS